MSPSCTLYSLPSLLSLPNSLALLSPLHSIKSSYETVSALIKPFLKSVCILPAASGAKVSFFIVQARASSGPTVK